MKRYIVASKRYVEQPMDRLYSKLGISRWSDKYKLVNTSSGKHNFYITRTYYTLDPEEIADLKSRIRSAGGKYIEPKHGDLYFYIDMNKFKEAYEAESKQAEDDYNAELGEIDIDLYKPSKAVLDKLKDYRDRGSKVNVKAIKDENKLLTYYYASKLLDWGELSTACKKNNSFGWSWTNDKEDTFNAISRRVAADPQYADTRTEFEKNYDLPDSRGLFTFEEKSCWAPKQLLMYFINNDIPVHFGKRTSGAHWDRNGRQWSEVEHLTLFPDSEEPIDYELVVHTDEGGGTTTYTGNRTSERTSIKNVIQDIQQYIEQ